MRKVMSWIKKFSFVIFVTVLSLEALSFAATKLNLFLVNETPLLYASTENADFPDIAYGRTEREKWGVWHASNATFRHRSGCFDVTMSFNEVGARDDSFHNVPSSALILLGDSFAEGYGVEREDMSEYLIERELDLSILNFGASGDFGPLQQLIIYKEFRDLPHQGLIIYVLPGNDFYDNDIVKFRNDQSRYRPYFSSTGDPLVPFYFPTAVPRDNFASDIQSGLKQFIKNNFWSANALRLGLTLLRGDENRKFITSFYYDATELQQSNLVMAYEAILDIAGNRNVLFVVIPGGLDIERREKERVPHSYQSTLWYQSFMDFKKRNEQRVEVLDLMGYLPDVTQDLFFDCDGHWSSRGNIWAADVVSRFIRDENLFDIER